MNELTIGEFPEKYTNAKCKTWVHRSWYEGIADNDFSYSIDTPIGDGTMEISKTHEVGIKIKNALDSGVFEAVAQAISEAFFRYAEIESIMGMVKREQDKSEKIGANKVRKAFHDLFEREY
jgi:hypothetical protein